MDFPRTWTLRAHCSCLWFNRQTRSLFFDRKTFQSFQLPRTKQKDEEPPTLSVRQLMNGHSVGADVSHVQETLKQHVDADVSHAQDTLKQDGSLELSIQHPLRGMGSYENS